MTLIDANILIYSVNTAIEQYPIASSWLKEALESEEKLGFPWQVLLAFLRIATHPRIFESPYEIAEASGIVDNWLNHPNCEIIHPGVSHWEILKTLLLSTGATGNLTNDAHIAALAIENGAKVCSGDRDFLRFPGVVTFNPIQ